MNKDRIKICADIYGLRYKRDTKLKHERNSLNDKQQKNNNSTVENLIS
jgi:hypothetical protein